MNNKEQKVLNIKRKATTVRFTKKEYAKIKTEAQKKGETIPSLIRKRYFEKKLYPSRFSKEDLRALLVVLNRMSTDVNEIARGVNTGVREGFHDGLQSLNNEMRMFKEVLRSNCGNC